MTKPLDGIGFQYGFNTNYLNKILKFWKTEYKWKVREEFLNKFAHFKTKISGLDIHFMHVKPTNPQGNHQTVVFNIISKIFSFCIYQTV